MALSHYRHFPITFPQANTKKKPSTPCDFCILSKGCYNLLESFEEKNHIVEYSHVVRFELRLLEVKIQDDFLVILASKKITIVC